MSVWMSSSSTPSRPTGPPLRYKDMAGVPHEERLARLAADREKWRHTEEDAARRSAVAAWRAEHPEPPIPPRPTVLFCAHGVMLGCGWPTGLVWAGGVGHCPCCDGDYPTISTGVLIEYGDGKTTAVEAHDRCHYCGDDGR